MNKFIDKTLDKIEPFFKKNSKTIISVILFVQLLFFVLLLSKNGVVMAVDSPSYINPALDFIKNGTMNDVSGPTLTRTPGYILFLAFVYVLTNYSNFVVVLLQILMCLTSTIIIYSLVKKLSGRLFFACLASLLYISDLAVYQNAISILTDTLFPFLELLALLFLIKYLKGEKKFKDIFLSLLFINLALLVRPQILYLNMILVVVLLVLLIIKKINIKIFVSYLLMFAIVFGGWSYRNYKVIDSFTYTPIRDRDYFIYYAPYVYSDIEGIEYKEALHHFEEKLGFEVEDYNHLNKEELEAMASIGTAYVKENFMIFIKCNFKGLFSEMLGPNTSTINNLTSNNLIRLIITGYCSGCLLLSYLVYAYFFLSKLFKQKWFDWFILLIVMYLMASTAIVGYSRYRLAFYSLCLIGTFECYKKTDILN